MGFKVKLGLMRDFHGGFYVGFLSQFQWLCNKLPEGKRNNGDKPMDFRMLYLVF